MLLSVALETFTEIAHMIESEELITLADAAALVPKIGSKGTHPGSVYRWARDGVAGHKLEVKRVGRKLATSREALDRFMAALGNQAGRGAA